MTLQDRIIAFAKLSDFLLAVANNEKQNISDDLQDLYDDFINLIEQLKIYNPWYIKEFVNTQLKAVAQSCSKFKIDDWILPYAKKIENTPSKNVGVIMAGNIPFVGFHDFISILITGHKITIKLSSKDEHLPKKIAEVLCKIEPRFSDKIEFTTGKLTDFEAIIATGSNNSSRYFEYYFSKVPNIIRKSRNSVAVLSGNETEKELSDLADDIMLYFGLGCRSISKVYVPENYVFDKLFEAIYKYKDFINHSKYANNYDYNRAIYLLNNDKFLENGFFSIKQNLTIPSPISVLHYEEYTNIEHVKKALNAQKENIQCIATNIDNVFSNSVKLGQTQFPQLTDYEDNINIIDFLLNM